MTEQSPRVPAEREVPEPLETGPQSTYFPPWPFLGWIALLWVAVLFLAWVLPHA